MPVVSLLVRVGNVCHRPRHRLNREKCCYAAMNGHNVVKFAAGTRLKRVNEATYLGHQITQATDIRHENQKMQVLM